MITAAWNRKLSPESKLNLNSTSIRKLKLKLSRPLHLMGAAILVLTSSLAVRAAEAPPALPDVSNFRLDWPGAGPKKTAKPRTNGSRKVAKKGGRKAAKKPAGDNLNQTEDAAALNARATNELTVDEKNKSLGIGVSTGTVNLTVDQIEGPFKSPAFQLGLLLQPYRPVGRSQVEGLDSYDTASLGTQPMGTIELRYLPFSGAGFAGSDLGFLASVGYSQHDLNLQTPSGLAVENAHLQTIVTEIDFADRYHFSRNPRWHALAGLGLGRLDSIQTATSALANGSGNLTFLGATLQAEYQFATRWSATGGYEFRGKVASSQSDLGIQNHNVLLGVLGSFR